MVIDKLESGSRPKGGIVKGTVGVPSLGAEHLNDNGGFNFANIKFITNDFFSSQNKGILEKEDILIVKDGATTGKVSFIGDDFQFQRASINEHLFKLSINRELALPKYVFWNLFSSEGKKKILLDFRGATVGGISRGFTKNIDIPLPSLEDQKQIVKILDTADALRQKRKLAITFLDDYIKSVFLNLFGDPVSNPKGWERVNLSEILLKIESGHSPVCLERSIEPGEWGVLKLGAITKCIYKSNENKALPDGEKPNPDIEIKSGDVLFSRKNTYELVAACTYVWETPPKLMMSDLIFRLVPRDKNSVNPIFLQKLLSFSTKRKIIQKLAGGSAGSMPNISKTKLLNIKIELPPISLQNQFADIIQKTETLKQSMQSQSAELETQFQSLLQSSFRGEL
jgi:type I restriction enzyme S subunit